MCFGKGLLEHDDFPLFDFLNFFIAQYGLNVFYISHPCGLSSAGLNDSTPVMFPFLKIFIQCYVPIVRINPGLDQFSNFLLFLLEFFVIHTIDGIPLAIYCKTLFQGSIGPLSYSLG